MLEAQSNARVWHLSQVGKSPKLQRQSLNMTLIVLTGTLVFCQPDNWSVFNKIITKCFICTQTAVLFVLQFPTLRDLYHESYRERGDLDEIQFLDNDPHLLPKGIV